MSGCPSCVICSLLTHLCILCICVVSKMTRIGDHPESPVAGHRVTIMKFYKLFVKLTQLNRTLNQKGSCELNIEVSVRIAFR